MRSSSKKVVAGLTLLSFVVGLTAGLVAEVPLWIVFGRSGLASLAFAGVSTVVVSLTERA